MSREKAGGRLREQAPGISGALERGVYVSVSSKVGTDVEGFICDRDESGLLVDTRDPSGDPGDYEFLPWASIERVVIGA